MQHVTTVKANLNRENTSLKFYQGSNREGRKELNKTDFLAFERIRISPKCIFLRHESSGDWN